MSYDIYFCCKEPTELRFDEIVAWSHQYPKVKREEGESQLVYENQDTGVYFLLEWSSPTEEQESPIPLGVYDTGLSFSLNYARPTFFALEAMPIVEALAVQFGVTMFDPQREPSLGVFRSEQLVESWSKSNQLAVGALAKDHDTFFRLSPDISTRFWSYMTSDSEAVLTPMAPYLREFDAGRDLQILPPENRARADKILKGLQGGLGKADFQTLSPDSCVDTHLV
jgi:hypothetical protein